MMLGVQKYLYFSLLFIGTQATVSLSSIVTKIIPLYKIAGEESGM